MQITYELTEETLAAKIVARKKEIVCRAKATSFKQRKFKEKQIIDDLEMC